MRQSTIVGEKLALSAEDVKRSERHARQERAQLEQMRVAFSAKCELVSELEADACDKRRSFNHLAGELCGLERCR